MSHPLLSEETALVFDESNVHWTRDSMCNELFLNSVRNHMNSLLQIRGHVFLNDVLDSLRMPRIPAGQVLGWLKKEGPNHVDFSWVEKDGNFVLEFNLDEGEIWTQI